MTQGKTEQGFPKVLESSVNIWQWFLQCDKSWATSAHLWLLLKSLTVRLFVTVRQSECITGSKSDVWIIRVAERSRQYWEHMLKSLWGFSYHHKIILLTMGTAMWTTVTGNMKPWVLCGFSSHMMAESLAKKHNFWCYTQYQQLNEFGIENHRSKKVSATSQFCHTDYHTSEVFGCTHFTNTHTRTVSSWKRMLLSVHNAPYPRSAWGDWVNIFNLSHYIHVLKVIKLQSIASYYLIMNHPWTETMTLKPQMRSTL